MIVVKLMGGLGNQMFQYAVGKCLAHLHRTGLYFDLGFFNDKRSGGTPRPLGLSCFDITVNPATAEQIDGFKKRMGNRYIRTLQRKLPILFDKVYFAESGSAFHKEFFSLPDNIYLDGYWQSERYFQEIENGIRSDFEFRQPLNEANSQLLKAIEQSNSVSLHVRRGDYVNAPHTVGIYTECTPEYYKKALDMIAQREKDIHVFIFSDDIGWCKQHLGVGQPHTYVTGNIGDLSYVDMRLMSACRHNIIANSSFSWWAAWLNKNAGKMIIVPSPWYKVNYLTDRDLVPDNEHWIRISA